MNVPLRSLIALLPASIVAVTGMTGLLLQVFRRRDSEDTPPFAAITLMGLTAALASSVLIARGPSRNAMLGGAIVVDDFSLFAHGLILLVSILAVLFSGSYLSATGAQRGEYYALLCFSVVGMLGLVSAVELVAMFVALEVMSVSLYALVGFHRDRMESQEAALKYFLSGAFASAFLLYGIAMLYGASGSTNLGAVARGISRGGPEATGLAVLGAGLLLVGFGFKLASVPFHMWAPDVYEGAPTPVTAFMSAAVKIAGAAALLRVLFIALRDVAPDWQAGIAILAGLTMVMGNLGALAQSQLKRMLAFSSIAHVGYLLTALVAAPRVATEAVLFYLVGYAAVSLGTFGALAALTQREEPATLDDVAGLAEHRPALAAALTVLLISLTGVPVSAGFVGKFYVFSAAVGAGYAGLAIVGVLMSVVSAFYYLRVVVAMYMRPSGGKEWGALAPASSLALAACVAIVVAVGIYPAPLLELARRAARMLG